MAEASAYVHFADNRERRVLLALMIRQRHNARLALGICHTGSG